MDNEKNHSLRKRLDQKLIMLVKPESMKSVEEYCIACNMEGIMPSVENGSYLHWLVTADGDDFEVSNKVKSLLLNAIEKKYLIDTTNLEQMSYFCDAVRDCICMRNIEWISSLIEAVMKNYEGTELYNYCKSLNKAFGFTNFHYFGY